MRRAHLRVSSSYFLLEFIIDLLPLDIGCYSFVQGALYANQLIVREDKKYKDLKDRQFCIEKGEAQTYEYGS